MEKHIVKILAAEFITHNVRRFLVEKPAGYHFVPGQATDVSINKPGMEEELRPFTFTSLASAEHLEFMIKIYKGHDGVTEKLGLLQVGEELIIHEVFGTIRYYDTGIFIAGGAGITPFVAILRSLQQEGGLQNLTLLFANHSAADIILKDELTTLLGAHFVNILRKPMPGGQKQLIDAELISAHTDATTNYYYICGPDQFTVDMIAILNRLGVRDEQIIIEK
ncbi:MAG: FAD-binding oxidoreductase [Sphingobacteriaceae bacterium]